MCVCVLMSTRHKYYLPRPPSLKEKRRKRPFEDKRRMMMTIEKIRIHTIIINLPQPLLRALRQSRTRSSRVRYSHRRRRSSSCHFLEQQQPRQKREGKDSGEKFVMMLFLGRNILFFSHSSSLCLFFFKIFFLLNMKTGGGGEKRSSLFFGVLKHRALYKNNIS